MKEQVIVAAACAATEPGEIQQNLAAMEEHCVALAGRGVELVLFPELSASGFIPNHPTGNHAEWLEEVLAGAWRMAQPIDGPLVQAITAISKRTGVFLAAGMLENAGNVLYNTHVLAGDGKVWGLWRKMHVPLFEMPVYNGGEAARVVDTPLGRIGVNICFDAFLPESTRLLAVQNAEIVLFPFAADPPPGTPDAWCRWAAPVLQARCSENAVFGIAANYIGSVTYAGVSQQFPGGAGVWSPEGEMMGGLESEVAVRVLERESLLRARSRFEYTFRFRRPELYGSLSR